MIFKEYFKKINNYIFNHSIVIAKQKQEKELKTLNSLEELVGLSAFSMNKHLQISLAKYDSDKNKKDLNIIELYILKGNLIEKTTYKKHMAALNGDIVVCDEGNNNIIISKENYPYFITKYYLTAKKINNIREIYIPNQKQD